MKPGVFVTFDVECSMGGAWANPDLNPVSPAKTMMGQFGDSQLGLPLILEIMRAWDIDGTFFVEVFGDELGYPGDTESVCKYLVDQQQDVQLHIHPGYMQYGLNKQGLPHPRTDNMADLSKEQQYDLLTDGCDRIARWTGTAPVAFRAGNMAASLGTLEQVEKVGLQIDSSYTFPYAATRCRFGDTEPFNGSKWYGNVLELSLSGFMQPVGLPGIPASAPLDLMGISFEECRDAIMSICRSGSDAVLILHSFSLFKRSNVQYENGRINNIVTRRLRKLCKWLSENKDEFPTYTFSQLAHALKKGEYLARASAPFPMPASRIVLRKAVQAVNNLYWL